MHTYINAPKLPITELTIIRVGLPHRCVGGFAFLDAVVVVVVVVAVAVVIVRPFVVCGTGR